jgi:hypothetical protein
MGRALRAVAGLAAVSCVLGCPATRHLRAYAGPERPADAVALLVEHHGFGEPQVSIERIDGRPLPPTSFWRGTHWEVELAPGVHLVEVSYRAADSRSATNATVPCKVEGGRRYEVRAARIKEGFASELGKQLAASFWPWVEADWVAWVVDVRTGAVVGGVEPRQSAFTTTMEPGGSE